jgi:hypothetical protein
MKRAAILIIVVATLVLVGYPSAPSLADTSNSISTSKSTTSGVITFASGGTVLTGSADTGGGSNEGDADGLSGLKGRPPVASNEAASVRVARVMMMLEHWWKFMLWSR